MKGKQNSFVVSALVWTFGRSGSTWRTSPVLHRLTSSTSAHPVLKGNYGALQPVSCHIGGGRWYRDTVRYQPKVPSFWFNLGIAYQRLNNQSAASAAFLRAYELQPTDPKYAEAAGKKIGTN